MQKTLKMVLCGFLMLAALFSFSAFSPATSSAHALPTGMNPHTTPAGFTGHTTSLQPAATTCYGQAVYGGSYTISPDLTDFTFTKKLTATQYCNDINVKVTQQAGTTQGRVIFYDKTTGAVKSYSSWKNISSTNTWYVLASDVLDGTSFGYEFYVPYPSTTFSFYAAW